MTRHLAQLSLVILFRIRVTGFPYTLYSYTQWQDLTLKDNLSVYYLVRSFPFEKKRIIDVKKEEEKELSE